MKNSSAIGALVLIGLAVAIGVYALQSDGGQLEADLVEPAPAVRRASFSQDLSPQERRKKANMEEAQRYLKRVKEEGTNVGGDLWRIKDDDGTPLYVVGHLIEGYDAFGEPKYLMHKIKRQAAVPVVKRRAIPEAKQPKLAKQKQQLEFIKKSEGGTGRLGNGDGSGGGGLKKGGADDGDKGDNGAQGGVGAGASGGTNSGAAGGSGG